MMRYSRAYGGADPEMVEGDVFRMTVRVPEFGEKTVHDFSPRQYPASTGQVTEQATEQVTEKVRRLLMALAGKELGARALMKSLRLSHRPTFLYDYLHLSLSDGLVEMTQPDSPKSPTQKYRLTEKGKQIVQSRHVEAG